MKAAKRIRDYLYVLKRDQPNRSRISMIPGAEPLTAQDLEAVLARLDKDRAARKRAEEKNGDMLLDLHAALWPDKPVHLHDFEHILTTIRNRQAIPDAERAERARLASQLAAAENEVADLKAQLRQALHEITESEALLQRRPAFTDVSVERERDEAQRQYRTLRQALREVCEAVLPLYADKDAGQQLAALQSAVERSENVVRAQKVLLAEIQNAADQVTGAHLFHRTWTSVPEQIRAVGIALSKAREQTVSRGMATALDETFAAIKTLYADLGGDPSILPVNDGPKQVQWLRTRIPGKDYVQDLQQQLREQGDAAARSVRKRKQAEDDLHELRIKISQICAQHTGGPPDGNAYAQLNQIQAWLSNPATPLEFQSQGVWEVAEARVYQQRVHAGGDRRELLAAALALASGVSAIYPFGETSWEGIRKYGGRRNQLAHAGACIAAIMDLMQPQEKVHPVGPETLNNGDFTDWSNE